MCTRIVFRTVFSLYVSNKSVFLYHIYFEGLVLLFLVPMSRTGCNVKQMKSIQFLNPSSVIYMRALVNSSTIANICWLIQIFKYQCCGFQVHFKAILVYNLKTKSDFDQKYLHYIMHYIINFASMFFHLSLVLDLAYIDYLLCQMWSVYMRYLWCCDHSNKCLFLVIQEDEVLLNFFGWVYKKEPRKGNKPIRKIISMAISLYYKSLAVQR